MIAHLREIVQALDGLTASLSERPPRHDADASETRDRSGRGDDVVA